MNNIDLTADGKSKQIKIDDSTIVYQVNDLDSKTVNISSIRTPTAKRGNGSARVAIEHFLEHTDKLGLSTKLSSSPLDKKTNGNKLYNFYVSLGYTPTGQTINPVGDKEMMRIAHICKVQPDEKNTTLNQFGGDEINSIRTDNKNVSDDLTDARRQYQEIENKFFNMDGSHKPGAMLAPNGEPTKLNKVQWIQVRTDNFKKWFGDWIADPINSSKMIDNNTKEPSVYYHGTDADISTFNIEKIGRTGATQGAGFYFTKKTYGASVYAGYGDAHPNVMPVFLNVRNIFNWGVINKKASDFAKGLSMPDELKRMVRRNLGYAFKKDSDDICYDDDIFKDLPKAITVVLIRKGFDGVIAYGYFTPKKEFNAFRPIQIK